VRDDGWRLPDDLWVKMEPLLPPRPKHKLGCHNPRGKRCGVGTLRFALRSKLHSSFPSDDGIAAGVPLAEQGLW